MITEYKHPLVFKAWEEYLREAFEEEKMALLLNNVEIEIVDFLSNFTVKTTYLEKECEDMEEEEGTATIVLAHENKEIHLEQDEHNVSVLYFINSKNQKIPFESMNYLTDILFDMDVQNIYVHAEDAVNYPVHWKVFLEHILNTSGVSINNFHTFVSPEHQDIMFFHMLDGKDIRFTYIMVPNHLTEEISTIRTNISEDTAKIELEEFTVYKLLNDL